MKTTENIEEYINYTKTSTKKGRIILGSLISFFIAVMIYFPLMLKTESIIKNALASIPGCEISYDKLDLEFFWLPKFIVKNVNIPAECLSGKSSLVLDKIDLNFRLFAFDPFGLSFFMNINALDTKIDGNIVVGIFEHAVNINNNFIELEKLSPYLGDNLKMSGKVEINVLSKFNNKQLKKLELNINSKNLTLPPQRIQILDLPLLNISNLLIMLKSDPQGIINVEKLIIGDEKSPIRANFTGTIKPNLMIIGMSSLDLKGELAFSEQFLTDFSLIKTLMTAYPQKDSFYQIRLKGQFNNLRPMPLQ